MNWGNTEPKQDQKSAGQLQSLHDSQKRLWIRLSNIVASVIPLTRLSTKNSEIIHFRDQKELRILSYIIEEYCERHSVQGLICWSCMITIKSLTVTVHLFFQMNFWNSFSRTNCTTKLKKISGAKLCWRNQKIFAKPYYEDDINGLPNSDGEVF